MTYTRKKKDMGLLKATQLQIRTFTAVESSEMEVADCSSPRTWLIFVQTCLAGRPVKFSSVAKTTEVVVPIEHCHLFDVEYFGPHDDTTIIFRLEEKERLVDDRLLDELKVRVVPRFESRVLDYYKLNDMLCSMAGRRYLMHPKYLITLVLTYARARNLMTKKFLICDKFLSKLFDGKPFLKLTSVWKHIQGLIRPVEDGFIYNKVDMMGTSITQSSLEVSLAMDGQIFPAEWPSSGPVLQRTESAPAIDQPSMSKLTEQKISKRALKRHKSL